MKRKKLSIMVSSTVYGIEELLERVFSQLLQYGYEVKMSHKGTVWAPSNRDNMQNCLKAVEESDLFLGIVTPVYGSSANTSNWNDKSITHLEFLKAIELNKPRWILTDERVFFMRNVLRKYGIDNVEKLESFFNQAKSGAHHVFDPRVILMHEQAIGYRDINGNVIDKSIREIKWAQPFKASADVDLFVSAQFSRYHDVEAFVEENFKSIRTLGRRFG